MQSDSDMMSAWFAGPKAENASWFSERLRQIIDDYYAWRRNYFPEDGVVVDSAMRRHGEPFMDAFEDRLIELLARLKGDVPFHSPRYAAHMLAEQTLPGIAGYFAGMLYNPNNVTSEVAPVTVNLELEAGRLLARMIGYDNESWSHLCSGGTAANFEALWVARSVKYLPFVVRDTRHAIGIHGLETDACDDMLLGMSPTRSMESYAALWREIYSRPDHASLAARAHEAATASVYNVAERGLASVCARLNTTPILLVPESHHYCFEKAMDLLGLGRQSLVSIRVDEHFRMRPDALLRAIDTAHAVGNHILAVVTVVGSTEEGSIDPVDQIVALRSDREQRGASSFWIHADGAYGGYLRTVTIPTRTGLGPASTTVKIAGTVQELPLSLPEHGECSALEQLKECDSVTIDPHKLGYIPYPAGAICFKSNIIKPLMRQTAAYIGDAPGNPEAERHSESIGLYVLEGSKPGASAAAVWLSHSLIPLDSSGHGRLMRNNIRNACELHALIEHFPALARERHYPVRGVCLCPPGSNIVCYAFCPVTPGASLSQINALNRSIFERFNLRENERMYEQSFFVSRTALSAAQYTPDTVGKFLTRLGVDAEDYAAHGIFLLRSVLMNPWYSAAKRRGRYFLSELVAEMFDVASQCAAATISYTHASNAAN